MNVTGSPSAVPPTAWAKAGAATQLATATAVAIFIDLLMSFLDMIVDQVVPLVRLDLWPHGAVRVMPNVARGRGRFLDRCRCRFLCASFSVSWRWKGVVP